MITKIFLTGALMFVAVLLQDARAANPPATKPTNSPAEIVLVETSDVSTEKISSWKKEGFKGVAMVLDERCSPSVCQRAAKAASAKSLDVYYWIEVARNPV